MSKPTKFESKSEEFFYGLNDDKPYSALEFLKEEQIRAINEIRNISFSTRASESLHATDKSAPISDTQGMNESNGDSHNRGLSDLEDRMDRRIQKMGDELQRELRLRERSARREAIAHNKALYAHIESNDKAVASTLSALERTEAEFGKVKQANKEQRYWMAGIGVAIVLGIMGANATIFGGGKAFFDGGRDAVLNQQKVESLIQESKSQSEANRALLEEIRRNQSPPAVTPKS